MNLKDFEKEYLSLLSSQDSDKLEKLIQLVADNTENMEIPTDYFIKVSDEVIKPVSYTHLDVYKRQRYE